MRKSKLSSKSVLPDVDSDETLTDTDSDCTSEKNRELIRISFNQL